MFPLTGKSILIAFANVSTVFVYLVIIDDIHPAGAVWRRRLEDAIWAPIEFGTAMERRLGGDRPILMGVLKFYRVWWMS